VCFADAKPLSDACNEEVMAFKINRNSNINKNLPLGEQQQQQQHQPQQQQLLQQQELQQQQSQ
jgi:hypothetical protein